MVIDSSNVGFVDATMGSRTRARGPTIQSNPTAPSQTSQSNVTAPNALFSPANAASAGGGGDEAVYMHTQSSSTTWNDVRPPSSSSSSSSSSFAPPSPSILPSTSTTASTAVSAMKASTVGPTRVSFDQERRVEFAAYDSISSSHRTRIASLLSSTSPNNPSSIATTGTTKSQGQGLAPGQGRTSIYPDDLSSHMAMATSTTFPGPSPSPGMGAARLGIFTTTSSSSNTGELPPPPSSSQRHGNYFETQSPMIALSQLPNPNDFREELYSPPPPGGITPSSTILPPSSSSSSVPQQQRGSLPFNSAGKRFGFHSGGGTTGSFQEGTLHSGGAYDPTQRGVLTNTELRGTPRIVLFYSFEAF